MKNGAKVDNVTNDEYNEGEYQNRDCGEQQRPEINRFLFMFYNQV